MRILIINFLSLAIICFSSLTLLEPNSAHAEKSNAISQTLMYSNFLNGGGTPCADGLIACQNGGGTNEQCWAGFVACLGCNPDNGGCQPIQ